MSDVALVGSDRCGLDDLFLGYGTEAEHGRLGLELGWSRRWTGTWRTSGGEVACAVRDLGEVPVAGCVPVRRRQAVAAGQINSSAGPRRLPRATELPQRFCQTDTCALLSAVNAERSQPAQRYLRLNPAIRAMRSISAGQAYRNGIRRNRPFPSADTVT